MNAEQIQALKDAAAQAAKAKIDALNATASPVAAAAHGEAACWDPWLVLSLSVLVMLFCAFTLLLVAYLIGKGRSHDTILPVISLPLIIFTAIFLIVVGYNDQQIAPAFGLLGTIAGYVLGRQERGGGAATAPGASGGRPPLSTGGAGTPKTAAAQTGGEKTSAPSGASSAPTPLRRKGKGA